ncbi:MAG: hypothetical protein AAF936_01390 [Pseudomonadota bacterium]
MTRLLQNSNRSPKLFCNATLIALMAACAACTTSSYEQKQWAAHGYLTPGPTGDSEVIGVFDDRVACDEAAQDWMSRQVVGNPVFAECAQWDGVTPPEPNSLLLLTVPG